MSKTIDFLPGDEVRFLNEEGHGTVIAADGQAILVATPDGFEIPYPAGQLVKVAAQKKATVDVFVQDNSVENTIWVSQGIFLAFAKKDSQTYTLHLINQTSYHLYFSVCAKKDSKMHNLSHGQLAKKSAIDCSDFRSEIMKSWPDLSVRLLYIHPTKDLPAPQEFLWRMNKATFFNANKQAPIINKDAFVFQLDGQINDAQQKEWRQKLKSAFSSKANKSSASSANTVADIASIPVREEVDLHLEAIPHAPSKLSVHAILKFQLDYAERMLDEAIAVGQRKIVFIHGGGQGVLKTEIQKLAKNHEGVSSFGKGNPNRYGNGATFFVLK